MAERIFSISGILDLPGLIERLDDLRDLVEGVDATPRRRDVAAAAEALGHLLDVVIAVASQLAADDAVVLLREESPDGMVVQKGEQIDLPSRVVLGEAELRVLGLADAAIGDQPVETEMIIDEGTIAQIETVLTVKIFVDALAVDAAFNQRRRHLQGRRGAIVLEAARVRDEADKKIGGGLLGDESETLEQDLRQDVRRRRGRLVAIDREGVFVLVGDMMVEADDFLGFEDALVLDPSQVGEVDEDGQGLLDGGIVDFVAFLDEGGKIGRMGADAVDLLLRIELPESVAESHDGADAIAVGIGMPEDHDRVVPFDDPKDFIANRFQVFHIFLTSKEKALSGL